MKLTEYKREDIQKLIKDGVCNYQTLRDYDLLKAIQKGEKITHAAEALGITYKHANTIRKRYS